MLLAAARISFARFIINFSREPTLAIKYIRHAKTLKQSISDNFFIYRYERLLEESCKNRIALDDSGNINVLNVLKYEKYQKEFNGLLELNGLMHMQFWTTLLDESPSMMKICDVGIRILSIDERTSKLWKKMQLLCPSNPKDLVAYSYYLKQVWNDNELASRISEKAKDSAYSSKYATIFTTHLQDIANFSLDGSACVFMSGDKKSLGKIMNCNLAFCRLFGYFKREIIGANIKDLMPVLIGEQHDKFVQRNLEKIKISCCISLSQDIFSVGLHRNRYIFPLAIRIISSPNILNNMQYIAKIKIDKKQITGTICYLLLNSEYRVVAMNSTCVNVLHLSINMLSNLIVDMSVMAPSLFAKDSPFKYFYKNGFMIQVYYPKIEQLSKVELNNSNAR